MRLWITVLVVGLAAACVKGPAPTPSATSPAAGHATNPSRIKRIARDMPSGYEVTTVAGGVTAPATIWGLGVGWTADPAQCAALADPAAGHTESAQGVSGSGAGGIVYAIVAPLPAARLDPAVVAGCPRWTVTNGRARSDVRLVDPPHLDGAETVAMASDTTTSAEGGRRIESHAQTFIAYLGDSCAFTTLVTDPGSGHSALPPQFAADLLVKTVSALRG
jgi:Domain of unknown function (DUF5642)